QQEIIRNLIKLVVMKKRKNYTSGFKTKVVLKALQERETIQEIGRKYEIHPNQISTWKSQFLANANSVFEKGVTKTDDEKEKEELLKKLVSYRLRTIS
ncbi:MAG: transposase, partial [Bacteroidia bacterium]|nr:transposase [Bacteroidia bacterium]